MEAPADRPPTGGVHVEAPADRPPTGGVHVEAPADRPPTGGATRLLEPTSQQNENAMDGVSGRHVND